MSTPISVVRFPYIPGSRDLITASPESVVCFLESAYFIVVIFFWLNSNSLFKIFNITTRRDETTGAFLGFPTRTIIFDPNDANRMFVSVGAYSDTDATSAHAMVRMFNVASIPTGGYEFFTNGTMWYVIDRGDRSLFIRSNFHSQGPTAFVTLLLWHLVCAKNILLRCYFYID